MDNEVTAKELLEKGRLGKRVTIIPLNKARYHNPWSPVAPLTWLPPDTYPPSRSNAIPCPAL